MRFTSEASSNGVVERSFTTGEVTGLLWSHGIGPMPLILIGHGGGQDKRARGVVARAHHFVTTCGFAVAAIDAPGHGDRPLTPVDEQHIADLRQAQAAGEPLPAIVRYNASLAERAVPEWRATLDALQTVPEIGAGGPVGYWGLALGTAIGVRLTAVEPRIAAAVFGLLGPESLVETAARVTVPVQFLAQSDEPADPPSGTELFDAFASTDKTLISNPAAHYRGRPFELESSTRFLLRHLGSPGV